MDTLKLVRLVAVLSPAVALLAVGLVITLRSGVASPASGPCRHGVAAILSQTLLQVVACVVILAALQQLAGFHLGLLR